MSIKSWDLKIGYLEKALLFLLIFFIPSNLAYHFACPAAKLCGVDGILVDYLIPKLYLTDIFILLLVIPWSLRHLRSQMSLRVPLSGTKQSRSGSPRSFLARDNKYLLVWFFLWTLFQSIFIASNQIAAVYFWLKLLEMSLLFLYLHSLPLYSILHTLYSSLPLSILFQSLLAWLQWILQRNVFPYRFLGESSYSAATAAIDKISWFGQLRVPPLGTTPHPNVLAGFLAVSLIILISRKKYLTTVIGFPALLLTHSLSGIFAFLLGLCLLIRKRWAVLPLITLIPLISLITPTSFSRRLELNQIAFSIIRDRPLGIGLNNFTYVMPQYGEIEATYRFLQPVHNIYLLLLSETGLIGFSIIFIILIKFIKFIPVPLLMVLVIGLVDHYPLTLQQGQLLLVLSFALPQTYKTHP